MSSDILRICFLVIQLLSLLLLLKPLLIIIIKLHNNEYLSAVSIFNKITNYHHTVLIVNHKKTLCCSHKIFLQTCAKFLCVKQGGYRSIPSADLQAGFDANADEFSQVFTDDNNANEVNSDSFSRSPTLALEKTLEEIRKYLRQLADKERSPQQQNTVSHAQLIQSEWQRLGDVMDRLAFWSYALTTFLMTVVLIGYK